MDWDWQADSLGQRELGYLYAKSQQNEFGPCHNSKNNGDSSVQLTGNPFVDVGLGITAARAGLGSFDTLSQNEIQKAISDLRKAMNTLKQLKILASFWSNNPFMGKNDTPKTRAKFETFLSRLGDGSYPTSRGYCQICGRSPVLAVEADRCWFPLAGGRDSDPCTLPELRGKAVCADCMAAVILLPLGCRSCSDGPYFVHVTEADLQIQAVSEGIAVVNAALAANTNESILNKTVLRGRPALLEIASGSLLWDHTQPGHLQRIPASGATMISFSNRGNGACFHQLHLPAGALAFFSAIAEEGVRHVFLAWATEIQKSARDGKRRSLLDELCDDIEDRRSLSRFLFAIVQARKTRLLGRDEYKVLEIYEDVSLRKRERFDALNRLSRKIRQMPGPNKDSFVKRLGNLGSKGSLLDLIKDFCRKESAELTITSNEIRALVEGSASETSSLLYLLCIAEEEEGK